MQTILRIKPSKITLAIVLVSILLVIASLAFFVPEVAANVDSVREGIGTTGGDTSNSDGKIFGLIETIVDIFSLVVGIVAVIMIIIGGMKYVLSSGDSSNVTSAKNTILYAIVGLVIVALAQVIVVFVLNQT